MLYHSSVKNKEEKSFFHILLIEDNRGDARLIEETMQELDSHIHLAVMSDGFQAMDYLHKKNPYEKSTIPDLILLDLNLPKKDGRQVLAEIKSDPNLKRIPVLILTISSAEEDILQCYNLYANGYVIKPFEIDKLIELVKSIKNFWFDTVTLPPKKE